jgi:hypothetical protein
VRGSKAKTDIFNIIKMKAATNKHINLYIFIHFLVFYHEIVMTFESGLRFHKLEHIESVTDNRSNKTDRHDITEILLKVALNTINPNPNQLQAMDRFTLILGYAFCC